MDALNALYPSSSTGSGITSSPLATPAAPVAAPAVAPVAQTPAAAPAAATQAPERRFRELSDTPDPDDPSRYLPFADQDAGHEDAEPQPAKVAEPVLDPRPKIDGWFADARENEPAASSITDYATFANADRPPTGIEVHDRAEFDLSLKAMQQAGLGQTTARAVFQTAVDAIRNPIATTPDAARASLQAQWGDKTDANLTIAKQQIDAIAKTWPGVRQMLDKTGLGNSPEFIKQLVNRAKGRG